MRLKSMNHFRAGCVEFPKNQAVRLDKMESVGYIAGKWRENELSVALLVERREEENRLV